MGPILLCVAGAFDLVGTCRYPNEVPKLQSDVLARVKSHGTIELTPRHRLSNNSRGWEPGGPIQDLGLNPTLVVGLQFGAGGVDGSKAIS